jgi:coenzyme PQQ precursor peptide PqqA
MAWKTPKIVEVPVGLEINMYACAVRSRPRANSEEVEVGRLLRQSSF